MSANETSSSHTPASLPVENSTSSFWHSEPNEFLIGHRSTADLPAEADVVIIGSGITGASAARWWTETAPQGKEETVVMLEAREACWGATGRNGGHCQPLLFDRDPSVGAFEVLNYTTIENYIHENNIECEWRGASSCRSYCTPAVRTTAFAEVAALKKAAPALGEKVTCLSDAQAIKEKYKVLEPKGAGATVTQGAASLWPYKYVAFILEKLVRSQKLNLQTNTGVESLEAIAPAPSKGPESEGRESEERGGFRIKVTTQSRGSIRARAVILATNAYTSHLVPSFADLIVPLRGIMTALLPPKSLAERLPSSYGFVAALGQMENHDDYLIHRPYAGVPNPRGHLMFGGGAGKSVLPRVGTTDDSVLDEGSAAYLRSALLKLLDLGLGEGEEVKELEASHQWSGIMGWSRDEYPWVGPVPGMEGVWMAAGYTGHGMPNGTLCAKAVVDMIRAEAKGDSAVEVQEQLVKEGNLPRGYLITKERIDKARALPTVQVQDETGGLGNEYTRQLREAQKAEGKKKGLGCVVA